MILTPNVDLEGTEYRRLTEALARVPSVQTRVHQVRGAQQTLTEIYLIGNTKALSIEELRGLPCVERGVRVSQVYRVIGRHREDDRPTSFEYNGVRFGQDNLNVFAGLCAVDTRENVERMMRALQEHGQVCTRMGAYKSRTSPYAFQGHGRACLPYVFELAGRYGIRVIAMEITHEDHIEQIRETWEATGRPTGVIAGANMVLTDFHPDPDRALVDGPQALRREELGPYLEAVRLAREAYQQRRERAAAAKGPTVPGPRA